MTKKLNAWYMAIKSDLVDEAERIKAEAEAELANIKWDINLTSAI